MIARARFALLVLLTLGSMAGACRQAGDAEEPLEPVGSGHGGMDGAAPPATPQPNRFDPGALTPGSRFMGLDVVSVEVTPFPEDTSYVGVVRFGGEVELTGTLRPHPDYPGIPEARFPCFYADSLSAQQLPRFPKDGRFVWFCFTNAEEAERMIGDVESHQPARIIIDDYQTVRRFTDAYDTARLLQIVQRGDPTSAK